MKLKKCILNENTMLTSKYNIKIQGNPKGIVVHSTGANNTNLARYVQPSESDANRAEILADIGENRNKNSWNRADVGAGVHAFIGKNIKGEIETYQTMPFDICAGGVGRGSKGSYNYNPTAHIQFEICEDDLTHEDYFNAVMKEAQEFCAYLCAEYDISIDTICSHKECYDRGYGSNHADIDHWLKKYGKDMAWFRAKVAEYAETAAYDALKKEIDALKKENAEMKAAIDAARELLNKI